MLNEKMVKTLFALVTPPIMVKSCIHSQLLGPSNLRSNINKDTIKLMWDVFNSEAVILFNIYRAVLPISRNLNVSHKIDFVKIKTIAGTNYIDQIDDYGSNKIFIYYVTSVFKEGGESSPSNYIKVIQEGIRMEFAKEHIGN